MTFAALQPLADRAALFTALRQDALSAATDALGEHRWDADMAAGTITFTANADPSRQLVTRAHLIATIAPGPRSTLWAWAHPQGDAHGVAAQLQTYGAQHGIAELTTAEVPFPADAAGDDDWIARAAHIIGGVAVELTGRAPYYSAPVGGGTRAVFLLDAPLPALTVADATIALPRILAATAFTDARTAVWDLARLAGWTLTWTDEAFSGANVVDATGSTTFRFDEQARISGIESSLHSEG
ncbi:MULTISPECIES: DUF6882 domain-containing protein [unclassified Microbacterium]|uniref:DUF6882 domain-containing protein n=1 Tax=unclassified Microbacterium TaxID=2609290 RepID=UPI000EA88420|nr:MULTISPECIES: DUF6882 domain-containing protein [unclassified Microbacterium]MBT2485157.1 hypothetical protein [Microbacterium sp. ISL-108]RKN67994.1 hypothetical protein D7252_10585 [Microbacterium sp. CGR2]